ncbi:hypothetical protein KM043_014306 [Ampulex compressa]|nr:hypothetical protein KM043_014306 [Ampulex compressa]
MRYRGPRLAMESLVTGNSGQYAVTGEFLCRRYYPRSHRKQPGVKARATKETFCEPLQLHGHVLLPPISLKGQPKLSSDKKLSKRETSEQEKSSSRKNSIIKTIE